MNNQLGVVEGLDENTTQSDNTSADETESRAGGQTSEPREMNFQMLVEFIRQQNEELSEKLSEKLGEKQNKQSEELKRHNEEQIGKIKVELQEHAKKWEEEISELQKKNESGLKELKNELKRHTKESKELREKDRQEWQEAISSTQKTVDQINNKIDTHIQQTNSCLLYTSLETQGGVFVEMNTKNQ